MPSFLPVTLTTMNYASVVFVGGMTIAFAWYYIWGRKNYQGPASEGEPGMRRASAASIPRV